MTTKHDSGKPRMDLIPLSSLHQVANVLEFGAKKYSENNWQTVPDAEKRYLSATLRHIAEYQDGNHIDRESGISHLAHAACSLIFLLWFENKKIINQQSQKNQEAIGSFSDHDLVQ